MARAILSLKDLRYFRYKGVQNARIHARWGKGGRNLCHVPAPLGDLEKEYVKGFLGGKRDDCKRCLKEIEKLKKEKDD